jgi:hypothetical protein
MLPISDIKRRRRRKQILFFLLGNALPLLLGLYGLKCIITLHGHLTEPNSKAMMHTFYFASVGGMASVMAGLGYISGAVFAYLSVGSPPDVDRKLPRRIMRGIIRWGSLIAMWFLWHEAHQFRVETPDSFFKATINEDDKTFAPVVSALAMVLGIIALLGFLLAMFQREKVKGDLYERGCQPLHIWWRPFAYWTFIYTTPFRVIYLDAQGVLHKAHCCIYTSISDSRLGSRQIKWLKDEVRDFIDV